MVGLGTVLVEEGVPGPGVVVELDVLAQLLQLGLELPRRLGREVVVLLGRVTEDGRVQPRVIGLRVRPRDEPVRRNDGLDGVGALGAEHQGQPPAHAEPDDPHLVATGATLQFVDGPAEVLGRGFHPQRHHLLAGLVGLGQWHGRPVVEVGRQGGEPGLGEPVTGVLDLVDQAPPLLQHDDSRRGRRPIGGHGDIALDGAPIARKFDDFTHVR